MLARIYRPARSVMTSGPSYWQCWVLEYEPEAPRWVEPLMGWTGSRDMRQQVRISFDSKEEAIGYARRHGIPYQVVEPHPRKRKRPKSYADNFRADRPEPWTH